MLMGGKIIKVNYKKCRQLQYCGRCHGKGEHVWWVCILPKLLDQSGGVLKVCPEEYFIGVGHMKRRGIVFLAEGIACESLKMRESKAGAFEDAKEIQYD